MDILKRIYELRVDRGWSEYQLAEASEISLPGIERTCSPPSDLSKKSAKGWALPCHSFLMIQMGPAHSPMTRDGCFAAGNG